MTSVSALANLAPIDAVHIVAGNERQHFVVRAVRERNAAVGRDSQRRSNTGHHFERNARVRQRFQFFAAASKDKRVAAFEPHHVQAAARAVDHHGADFFLRKSVHRFLFADVNALAILGREFEQVLVGQVVVKDGVGDREQLAPFPGDEAGVAGARADEINLAPLPHGRGSEGWA